MMKNIICSLFLLSICSNIYAQKSTPVNDSLNNNQKEIYRPQTDSRIGLNLITGRTFSKFLFSAPCVDQNTRYVNGNVFGGGVDLNLKNENHLICELIFQEAGAKSQAAENQINWRINYLGVGIGVSHKLMSRKNYTLSTGIITGIDYMLSGIQTMNQQNYDLKESEAFKIWNSRGSLFLDNIFDISENFSINLQYRFNQGLTQIEKKDQTQEQKTRNIGHILQLLFKIRL